MSLVSNGVLVISLDEPVGLPQPAVTLKFSFFKRSQTSFFPSCIKRDWVVIHAGSLFAGMGEFVILFISLLERSLKPNGIGCVEVIISCYKTMDRGQ